MNWLARSHVIISTHAPDDFNTLFSVLATLPESAGQISMCVDIGHANLFAETRNDYLRFADQLGDHVPIIHCHAHENWGNADSHLPMFEGPSSHDDTGIGALARRLKKREFQGSVLLEQWPQPPEILVRTRQRLRELFDAE